MPDRIVRASILTSDSVDYLSWAAEVFYRRLLNVVDDFGRFDGRTAVLRAGCFPLRLNKVKDADVELWLGECHKSDLVLSYIHEGKKFIYIPKLGKPRADCSKYPAPPDDSVSAHENTCAHVQARDYTGNHANEDAGTSGGVNADVPYSYSNAYPYSKSYSNMPAPAPVGTVPHEYPPGFLRFWQALPKVSRTRSSRKVCFDQWTKLKCEPRAGEIIDALDHWKKCVDWRKDGGNYIPGAHRWLKDEKWEDVPEAAQENFEDPDDPDGPGPSAESIQWLHDEQKKKRAAAGIDEDLWQRSDNATKLKIGAEAEARMKAKEGNNGER